MAPLITLVLVTLYGGADGLNTVIPYADPAYAAARPELSYRPDQVLRLDDAFGLNPGLPGLHRLWGERRLAIVRGADVVPSPAPGDQLRAGDVLVAIGSDQGLEQLDRRLSGDL